MTTRRDLILGGAAMLGGYVLGKPVRSALGGKSEAAKSGWQNPYVSDGLVAMWDGIENAGWGQHDASLNAVVNLMNQTSSTAFTVNDNSFNLGKNEKTLLTGGLPDVLTIEYVFTDIALLDVNTFMLSSNTTLSRGLWLMPTNFYMRRYNGVTGRTNYDGKTYGSLTGIIQTTAEGQPTNVYAYGQPVSTNWTTSSTTFTLDRITASSTTKDRNVNFHSIRLYSRALTAEEIVHNYAVDKARFNLP